MSNKSKNKSKKREFDDISSLFSALGSEAEAGYRDFPISEIPGQAAQTPADSAVSAQQHSGQDPKSDRRIGEDQQGKRAVFVQHANVVKENHSPTDVVPADDRLPLRPEELNQDADSRVRSTAEHSSSVPASTVVEPTTVSMQEFFVSVYSPADAVAMTADDNNARQNKSAQTALDDQWEWYDLIPVEQRAGVLKTRESGQKNPFAPTGAAAEEQDGVSAELGFSHTEEGFWLLPDDDRVASKDVSTPPIAKDRISSESVTNHEEKEFWLLPSDDRVFKKEVSSLSSQKADFSSAITPPVEAKTVAPAVIEKDSKQTATGSYQSESAADASDTHQKLLNSVTNRFRDSFLRGVEKAHTQMQVPDTRFKRVQSKLFESELDRSKNTSESSKISSSKRQSFLDDYWLMTSGRRGSKPTLQAETKAEPRQHQPRQTTYSTNNQQQPKQSQPPTAAPAQPALDPNTQRSPSKPARSDEPPTQKRSQDKPQFAPKPHSASKKKKGQSRYSKRRPRS